MSDHAIDLEENNVPQPSLLEQVLDKDNIQRAYKRVKSNKGKPGIDGMTVEAFFDWGRKYLPAIIDRIRTGYYKPAPVRRAEISKPNGDKRPLGIPTVLDRVIQQSIAQVISPIFDVDFNEESYGFRANKRGIDAVEKISEHVQNGYKWGIDCDLKSFFDIVNHDILMHYVGRKIRDKMLLKLIGKYLRAGVRHRDGRTEKTTLGVPQGGPLSPLLANIMLDPLDKEIEAMGLPFVRYADDFLVLCRSKAEALKAQAAISDYITGTLKLIINEDKSQIAPVKDCEFLSFRINGKSIKRSDKAAKRFKSKIRKILSRRRGIAMSLRLKELREYVTGWFHYFKRGLCYAEILRWDQWIRRKVRCCFWKQWKKPGRRRKMLIKLGIDRDEVKLATRSRKGYWRMSHNSIVQRALTNEWLKKQGVRSLKELWNGYKYPNQSTTE